MHAYVFINKCMCYIIILYYTWIVIFPSSVCWWVSKSSNTSVGISTSSIQIFILKSQSPIKITRAPWRNGWSWGWDRVTTKKSLEHLFSQKDKCSIIMKTFQKDTGASPKCLQMAKARKIWGIKKNESNEL